MAYPVKGDSAQPVYLVGSAVSGIYMLPGDNSPVGVLASAIRNASLISPDQINLSFRGAYILWDITAVPGAGETAQLFVDIAQPDGSYTAIYQTLALSTIGLRKYLLYPGAVDTGAQLTAVCQLPLPRIWRVRIIHSAAGNFTYAVGAYYVV